MYRIKSIPNYIIHLNKINQIANQDQWIELTNEQFNDEDIAAKLKDIVIYEQFSDPRDIVATNLTTNDVSSDTNFSNDVDKIPTRGSVKTFVDNSILSSGGGGGGGISAINVSDGNNFNSAGDSIVFEDLDISLDPTTGDIIVATPDYEKHLNKGVLDGLAEMGGQLYYKSSSVSKGDMFKTTYDKNNDGIVDVASTLSGLIAKISELNYLTGLTSNVQIQLNSLSNVGNFSGSVTNYSDIATTFTSPTDKDMVIVISDENNNGSSSIYVYSLSKASWQFAGVLESPVRNFSINPLDINTETKGILQDAKIGPNIARLSDTHTHINLDVLRNLADDGNNGLIYKGSPIGSGTGGGGTSVPTLREISATATLTANQTLYMPLSTTFNKYDIRTLRASNNTNTGNIVVEIHDKAIDGDMIYKSNSQSTIYDIINIPCEDKDATQLMHVFVTNLGTTSIDISVNVKATNLL